MLPMLVSIQFADACECIQSDDGSTVEYVQWTGTTDCNESGTATTFAYLPFDFDPINYPELDQFNCADTACPHYVIEFATAHPTQTCPFDTGKEYLNGEDD